jgi:hypothetical protein
MGEFFFVLKTMVFTIALILCLQIKIGQTTIEQRSLTWMRQSIAIDALRGVADGAVSVAGEGYAWAKATYEKRAYGSETKHVRRTKSEKDLQSDAKKAADAKVELD